jgi:hypothetical protein
MHVQVPKPLHGWRAFAGEVGIIVLGVLIALGFGQIVEEINWRFRVNEAREQLHAEVGHGFLVVEERVAVADCIDRQLNRIEDAVMAGGSSFKPLPAYRDFGLVFTFRAPLRSWSDSAWQGVIAEGIAPHFDTAERDNLRVFYAQMVRQHALGSEEEGVVGDLLALSKPLRMSPDAQTAFVREIEAERVRNATTALTGAQIMRAIQRAGYLPSAKQRRDWLAESGTVQFCRGHGLPLGNFRGQG